MEKCPPLHLGVVPIEKGSFGSPLTMVTNFMLIGSTHYAKSHSNMGSSIVLEMIKLLSNVFTCFRNGCCITIFYFTLLVKIVNRKQKHYLFLYVKSAGIGSIFGKPFVVTLYIHICACICMQICSSISQWCPLHIILPVTTHHMD